MRLLKTPGGRAGNVVTAMLHGLEGLQVLK